MLLQFIPISSQPQPRTEPDGPINAGLTHRSPMGARTPQPPGCTATGGYSQSAPVTGAAWLYATVLLPQHGPQQQQVIAKRERITGPSKGTEMSGGALAPQPCRTAPSLPVPALPSAPAAQGEKFKQKCKAVGQKPKSNATELSTEPGSIPLPGGDLCRQCYFPKGKSSSSSPCEPRASLKKLILP